MFHVCVARFDVTRNMKSFAKFSGKFLKSFAKNYRFSVTSNLTAHA